MLKELEPLFAAYKKAHNEEVGLYQIYHNIKNITHIKDILELRQLTLDFITAMLAHGFETVDLQKNAPYYKVWENQNSDYVVNRIKTEWLALGREPNIGDIVWFLLKS